MRFRHQGLQKNSVVDRVVSKLETHQGVDKVSSNRKVGSLLVCYDQTVVGGEAIVAILQGCLPKSVSARPKAPAQTPAMRRAPQKSSRFAAKVPVSKRQVTNLGMAGSLAGSVAALFVKSTSVHVQLGLVFVALSAYHMVDKRRTLLV